MATGPEHYAEAERLRAAADEWADADTGWKAELTAQERINQRLADLADAQVHATLALAAATALTGRANPMYDLDLEAWDKVAGVQEDEEDDDPYEGLTNADVLSADELYAERAAEAHLDSIDEERYREENAANLYDDEHYDVDDEDGGEDQ